MDLARACDRYRPHGMALTGRGHQRRVRIAVADRRSVRFRQRNPRLDREVLTMPLTIMTLGLFALVVNALMLQITDWWLDRIDVDGFLTRCSRPC